VQRFYESRIAALERYMAFCVMFHAMAVNCCDPWFRLKWNTSRSQSNLRVATTASPISMENEDGKTWSQNSKKIVKKIGLILRKVEVNF